MVVGRVKFPFFFFTTWHLAILSTRRLLKRANVHPFFSIVFRAIRSREVCVSFNHGHHLCSRRALYGSDVEWFAGWFSQPSGWRLDCKACLWQYCPDCICQCWQRWFETVVEDGRSQVQLDREEGWFVGHCPQELEQHPCRNPRDDGNEWSLWHGDTASCVGRHRHSFLFRVHYPTWTDKLKGFGIIEFKSSSSFITKEPYDAFMNVLEWCQRRHLMPC